ncbi:MAG: hypothetical protein A4E55_01225 [Pelotomaculum sp. PtaU1.Bin035]|nr:MAG: hypothetical protein A4E55_01225 [Pelotomaculum sp. PtaU1.Bin035]
MPFDGLVLAAVRKELNDKLTGGRIEKIYQPDKDEIVLSVHRMGSRCRLLLSANAQNARIHLTSTIKENPITPPLFCMVLRKHLEGGRVISFEQNGLERVLLVKIDSRDELGHQSPKHLICEIMGKHSNIILVEPSVNTIIDGIKRYSHAVSRYREVLPGRPYLPPPPQKKLNPLLVDEGQFRLACLDSSLETALPDLLQRHFEGLSAATCREIVFRSNLSPDTILDQCGDHELRAIWLSLYRLTVPAGEGRFEPCLTTSIKGKPQDFAAIDLNHTRLKRKHGEMNSLIDIFFSDREQTEKINKTKKALINSLKKEIARLEKKLDLYEESLDETAGAEKLRLYGELLTANLYRLGENKHEVSLENFHEKGQQTVTIPLDPHRSPAENSQAYFKKYLKAKNTRSAVELQVAQAREELNYLEGVGAALDQAGELSELEEVRQELIEQRYLKQPAHTPGSRKNKKEKLIPKPLSFRSSDGFQLFVGKNNKQNDYLTLKMARESDLWLHTKDIPGAHVIIKTEEKEVTPTTLSEAAGLAAFFSKARGSKNVPVDYTLKKHVSKPRGARPGMVIYGQQKTIMAVPDEDLVKKLSTGDTGQSIIN